MPDTGLPAGLCPPVREAGFAATATEILTAAKILSDRIRGRAELYRIMNQTSATNDYDYEADTIDAVLGLAAPNHYKITCRFDTMVASSSRRKRAGASSKITW
jgi:hypothetical protein